MVAIIVPAMMPGGIFDVAGATAAAAGFSLAWAGNLEDASGGTTITFTAVPIGVADVNRIVGVGVWWRSTNDSDTITSMTVGGVSATQAAGARPTRADLGLSLTDIWYAAVPTGTTANIVVNFSVASLRAGVSTYRIITTTPAPTNTANGFSAAQTSTSGTLTIPSGGAGFAMYGYRAEVGTGIVWTNATRDYQAEIGAGLGAVSSAKVTVTNAITAAGPNVTGAASAISGAAWS